MSDRTNRHKRLTIGIILAAALISLGNFDNPPNGFTGAPGESLCTECHSLNGGMQNGSILVNGFPAVAIANQTYPLTVTVANPNGIADIAGFQMVILDASNNNAGTLSNPGPGSTVTVSGGRSYHEHNPGQDFGMSNVVMWTVDWTAPVGSGQVTYYSAGNVSNGSGTDNGDLIVTKTGSGTLMTPLMVDIIGVQDVSCFGGMDGSVTAEATFGDPGYSYNWSNGGSGPTISGLGTGIYTVTVTDNAGATATASAEVIQPTLFEIVTTTVTHVSCNGGSDGQIVIFLNGGVPPYSGAIGDTYTLSNLQAGFYTVSITDANGCLLMQDFTITEPPELSLEIIVLIEPDCAGEATGLISVEAIGGTGDPAYDWSNGETSSTIQNLEAGVYSVTVTDENGCTATETIFLDDPDLLFVELLLLENVSCHGAGDGQIMVDGIGGTGGITFSWSDGNQGPAIDNLPPGDYTVTVTDDNGCTDLATYTIIEPDAIDVIISGTESLLCFGDDDGMLTAIVAGGTIPYSYAWSDGQTLDVIDGLEAGIYDLTVTDANGCTGTSSFEISEPPQLLANASATDESGPGNMDGSAIAMPTGGTGAYTFLWSNGATTAEITGLSVGIYTVTVTDDNGCSATQSVTVSGINCTLSQNILSTNVLCFGEMSGTAQVQVSGGIGPHAVLWSTGDTVELIAGLTAGMYSVTVTDSAGCLTGGTTTVSQPPLLTSVCNVMHESSDGANDGSITCSAGGGTSPYSYLWSTGDTMAAISGLVPGTYVLTITDDNGCEIIDTSVVNSFACNVVISLSVDPVLCSGDSTGAVLASASGGTEPYIYAWSNGSIGAMISDLIAGIYQLTLTDANNCIVTAEVNVPEPEVLSVAIDSIFPVTVGDDGAIFISASGGTPPYAFMWTQNGELISTEEDASGLVPGEYLLQITDANNCTISVGPITVPLSSGTLVLEELQYQIWPNPVRKHLWLSGALALPVYEIALFSYGGSLLIVWSGSQIISQAGEIRLNTDALESGLYYIRIRHRDGMEVHPFIKVD